MLPMKGSLDGGLGSAVAECRAIGGLAAWLRALTFGHETHP